jgi:FtsH-binding integral membrane protein
VNKKILFLILLSALILPVTVLAAVNSIQSLSIAIANVVWVVFTVVALVAFVVAGIMFLTSGGDPSKLTLARSAFFWGLAGVVVGIVAFSIINITCNALGASC